MSTVKYINEELNQCYQPYISSSSIKLCKDYISAEISLFFKVLDIKTTELFTEQFIFSDILFNKLDFSSFFYSQLFNNLNYKNINNFPTKYAITINKSITDQQCSITGRYYSCIKLNNKPVLYYIYFDIQEIADAITKNLVQKGLI